MANVQQRAVERIVGRSLLTTETLASEERARIVRRLAGLFNEVSDGQLLAEAAGMLAEFQPVLEETVAEAEVAGSIAGVSKVINDLPAESRRDIESTPPTGPPGTGGLIFPTTPQDPIITFPVIDRAAESLAQSRVLSRQDFLELGRSARLDAFTVAQQTSVDTLSTIRDVLAETIEEGASLQAFKDKLTDGLEGSFLGPAHLETVFRTNVQTRFNNAFRETAKDPIVSAVFPYQQYFAVRDDRARQEHRDLEFLGLNGTNIYRVDDPFWNLFLPPWDYNCRCGINLLTIERAAELGVKEAQEWLRTGVPPLVPEWRLDDIPFRPPPDFQNERLVA